MLANPALQRLLHYGLTEYEGRTYLALLAAEHATARELASLSRVPRTKIYGVLDELQAKGLAQPMEGRPKRYGAVTIEAYLGRFEDEMKVRLEHIRRDRLELAGEFRQRAAQPSPRAGNFHVVKGRVNVVARIVDMMARAERELLVSGSASLAARLLSHADALEAASKRGARVRVVCGLSEGNVDAIPRLRNLAEVRPSPLPSAASATLLIDARESLMVHFVPDDGHPVKGDDVGIWSDDAAIVADLVRTIEQQWVQAGA